MTPDTAIESLRELLRRDLDTLTDAATEAIVGGIEAYRDADEALRADIREHVRAHLRTSIELFGTGRDVTREELLFIRRHAAQRAKRVSLSDFVHAFYVGERVLWDAVLARADDEETRTAVLAFASHMPRYFEVATTHAAEVYLEAEADLAATSERIRRDLVEDLLAGLPLEPGPRRDAARAAGLREDGHHVVISAAACGEPADGHVLRGGAAALGRAAASRHVPLAVVRHDEIVAVLPVAGAAADALTERLRQTQARLAGGGLALSVGVSTAVLGLAPVPEAYREANMVRGARGATPGVAALTAMSAFEYLTLRPDPTAGRLIAAPVHEFIAQDAGDGGTLIATLRAYVDCDLNTRRAAEALHVHVNTAHYRLARIEERTGRDVRHVSDLLEILIAARLAGAVPAPAGP